MPRSRTPVRPVLSLLALMVLGACATSAPAPPAPDASGEYEFQTRVEGSRVNGTVVIEKGDDGYTGTIEAGPYGYFPITSVEMQGDGWWLIQSDGTDAYVTMEMFVDGEDVSGNWSTGDMGGEFTGKKVR